MKEGLYYQDHLPVELEKLDHFPEDLTLAMANEANEWFLKAFFSLHESQDIDEHEEVQLELRRQDLKINLLLDMVSELLREQKKIPPLVELRLRAGSLECPRLESIQQGDKLKIGLYISNAIPRALQLFGVVEELAPEGRMSIDLHGVTQGVQDWIDKLIFRYHRRLVAQQKALGEDQAQQ